MAVSEDEYDSDDSGFGFDDGLSTDQELLGRIAKMRNMINLAGDSDAPPPAAAAAPVPPLPAPTVHAVAPPAGADEDDEQKTTTAETTTTTTALDEDEFLLVDRVHTLALSAHREQTLQAVGASDDVLSGPRQGAATTNDDDDEEGEIGAEDEDEDDEDDGYVVTWARGQLGLLFKAGARGETLIRRINKKTSSAEGLHLARVGDVLVAVNGVSVRGRAFQELVEQLRLPDFPVTLSFQPLKLSDDDDDDDGDDHTVRTSEQREMERKQSSVSAISSGSSTNASFSAGHVNGNGLGAAPAHRLNQLAPSHGSMPHGPPPPYGSGAASLSRSQSLEDPLGPGEYDVVWRHGALGCGIKQRNGLPTIKSVTPGVAVDASVQQIEQDDVMIRINGIDTDSIGFRAVVDLMQRAPKPLYMRFRRAGQAALYPTPSSSSHGPPLPRPSSRYDNTEIENLRESRATAEDGLAGSLSPHQYTVLWNEGPLGVQIKRRPTDGAVVVTKFTGNGNPELLSAIEIGDVFVRIAGLNVADMGITGTYEKLKTVHKPVVLVFERSPPQPYPNTTMPTTYQSPQVQRKPASPPPAPAVRQGFAAEDMRDSTVVPSFRELREREAAANQGRYRDSFSGFTAEERGESVFGATERRAALVHRRPASYDTIDGRDFDQDGPRSRHSFPQPDQSGSDARYQDRSSDPSGDNSGGRGGIGTDGSEFLPRFSDIEKGRVKTTTVSTLPPPPAYHDTFTPSGRFLDPNQFAEAPQPPVSPHSDGRQGSSVSSGQGRSHLGPPPAYNQPYGYTPPTLPPGVRNPTPYSMPAPPAYDQYGGNYPRGGGGGGFGGSNRIDVLRQQYIESERQRNQQPPSGVREGAMTEISTYSDLDDSGIMAAMRRPADRMRMQMSPAFATPPPSRQPLPAPELWIQWSEGPLGITFRRTNGQIVVSRLTGAGYSRGLDQLRAGDWLLSIGNQSVGTYSTSELRLAETMELIKKLPKPVDMRFVVR